jgi:hypothetical protein
MLQDVLEDRTRKNPVGMWSVLICHRVKLYQVNARVQPMQHLKIAHIHSFSPNVITCEYFPSVGKFHSGYALRLGVLWGNTLLEWQCDCHELPCRACSKVNVAPYQPLTSHPLIKPDYCNFPKRSIWSSYAVRAPWQLDESAMSLRPVRDNLKDKVAQIRTNKTVEYPDHLDSSGCRRRCDKLRAVLQFLAGSALEPENAF